MSTPENTNPNILREMLENSGESGPKALTFQAIASSGYTFSGHAVTNVTDFSMVMRAPSDYAEAGNKIVSYNPVTTQLSVVTTNLSLSDLTLTSASIYNKNSNSFDADTVKVSGTIYYW